MARPALRIAIVAALVASALVHLSAAPRPSLDELRSRLGAYITSYEDTLSAVVAEEDYRQEYRTWFRPPKGSLGSFPASSHLEKRRSRAEVAFLRLPVTQAWLGFRDTFEVNGKTVRDAHDRLRDVLSTRGSDGLAEAARIGAENGRFNLGNVPRTINSPTATLDLLSSRNQLRFELHDGGDDQIDGIRRSRIDFSERTRPTIIRTLQGLDQPARGSVWVDPMTGTVVKTVLHLGEDSVVDDFVRTVITIEFREDPGLAAFVPKTMIESYYRPLQPDGRMFQIMATASYSNFRRFEASSRLVGGSGARD